MALMTGAGIGVDYSDIRAEGKPIRKTGGTSTGPIALMQMLNECGRGIMQGGSRRSAIWAGLNWKHPDIHKFITIKNWSSDVKKLKEKDFNFPAILDGTNISVLLDDEFFKAYNDDKHQLHTHAQTVYWATVKQMLSTAEPGFSIDLGDNKKETLRNACTEITSEDDSDICNLGSINMAKINSLEEMKKVTELATAFLLAGTVYSDVPYAKVDQVRTKNRRLGLGLMGLHEWLLLRNKKYGPDPELEVYMKEYQNSDKYAEQYAEQWELTVPVKTRAIAPTGSIGIIAETTTGIEPIFCVAYKRRYLKHTTWHYQYVIDPTAKRLIEEKGVNPDLIEDAYALSENVEKRLEFQAWLQQYVDHAISSTINLPSWGSELNNDNTVRTFGKTLFKYLPKLRGITCYPDGCRGGQPLSPVKYSTAVKNTGEVFIEQTDICDITKGGSCGS
jgi:ribonucleoside-diphosphate reductase alpha chain